MNTITKHQCSKREKQILNEIKQGATFIYPTDTIYGIGCDARNEKAVQRIRRIKQRDRKPFSVIAPSKKWIREYCTVDERWLKKLPGKYTLIVKLKKRAVARSVALDSLGVRIPDHWFSRIVRRAGFPIVTTSVNMSGGTPMTSLKDADPRILKKVDFVIYDRARRGSPSKVFDLRGDAKRIR